MTVYCQELANEICKRLAEGESLLSICREKRIDYGNVFNWLKDEDKKDFLNNYTRARETQADYYADQIIEIADDTSINHEDRRIRIDARKWKAGTQKPKKYGEKRILSGDDENPVYVKHTGTIDIGADALAAQLERVLNK